MKIEKEIKIDFDEWLSKNGWVESRTFVKRYENGNIMQTADKLHSEYKIEVFPELNKM